MFTGSARESVNTLARLLSNVGRGHEADSDLLVGVDVFMTDSILYLWQEAGQRFYGVVVRTQP